MSIDFANALLWGLVASAAMITILQGSQSMGWSRLNLPFLVGTIFTEERHRAVALGLVLYLLGGWLFAFIYVYIFESLGIATWWAGGVLGLLHGVGLITSMHSLPHIHPRVASKYDGPSRTRRIEPPGTFGLNYGPHTPVTTVLAQVVYGVILGAFYPLTG
jgi:hypothetical protein